MANDTDSGRRSAPAVAIPSRDEHAVLAARFYGAGLLLQRACEALEADDAATALEKARFGAWGAADALRRLEGR